MQTRHDSAENPIRFFVNFASEDAAMKNASDATEECATLAAAMMPPSGAGEGTE